jgi:hypothetical protein
VFQSVNVRSVVDSDLLWLMAEVRAVFFTARAIGATLKETTAAAGVSKTTSHYWLVQS